MIRSSIFVLWGLCVISAGSVEVDLGNILHDGAGYRIESVDFARGFGQAEFSVIKDSLGKPILLSGLLIEKNTRIEIAILFADARPIAYSVKEWRKITHPSIPENGEGGEVLARAKSGLYGDMRNAGLDNRLIAALERSADEVCRATSLTNSPEPANGKNSPAGKGGPTKNRGSAPRQPPESLPPAKPGSAP